MKRRARNVMEIGWASFLASWAGRSEHLPHWQEYPDAQIERISFRAGGDLGWRIWALRTPRTRPASWKVVVVTGAPSWAEYWTSTLAAAAPGREMVVVDRPGFGASEPDQAITDMTLQAKALSPLLDKAPGQKLLLVGQSYGAGIAALMTQAEPHRVDAVLLLSGLLGDAGPTAARLVEWGARMRGMIPRDLRNAVAEIQAQASQRTAIRRALETIRGPIHIVHGDRDDFAPIGEAQALAQDLAASRARVSFRTVEGDHFLSQNPPGLVLDQIEEAIRQAESAAPSRPDLLGWLRQAGEKMDRLLRRPAARPLAPL